MKKLIVYLIAIISIAGMFAAPQSNSDVWKELSSFGKGVGTAKIVKDGKTRFVFFVEANRKLQSSELLEFGVMFTSLEEAADFASAKPKGVSLFAAGPSRFVDDAGILGKLTNEEIAKLGAVPGPSE